MPQGDVEVDLALMNYPSGAGYYGNTLLTKDQQQQTGWNENSYNTWLSDMASTPGFYAMQKKYGDAFVEFELNATFNHWTDEARTAELLRRGWSVRQAMTEFPMPGLGGGSGNVGQQQNMEAEIRNLAMTLGVPMDDNAIKTTASTAAANNWSQAMVEDFLVGSTFSNWGDLKPGVLTATTDIIKQMAAQQLISISDTTAQDYAKRYATSEFDLNTLKSVFQQQAAAKYSWAGDILKQGVTMKDYLAPSRDQIARELEQPPDSIDMMDPKWSAMMQVEGANGWRAANERELVQAARSTAEFSNTNRARELASSAATMLRQYMGM